MILYNTSTDIYTTPVLKGQQNVNRSKWYNCIFNKILKIVPIRKKNDQKKIDVQRSKYKICFYLIAMNINHFMCSVETNIMYIVGLINYKQIKINNSHWNFMPYFILDRWLN